MCPSADLNANLEVFALRLISSFFVYRDARAHENAMNFWRNHFLFRSFAVCVCVSAGCCFFIHFIFPPSTTNFMATTNNEQTIIIVELIGATTL